MPTSDVGKGDLGTVVVVGGGITGLAATHALAGRCRVVLLEAEHRLGGKIRSDRLDDIVVDAGPDSFVRRDSATELCRALGLGDRLIEPAVFGAFIWAGGKLKRAPSHFFYGMPASPTAALRSRILSPLGALRAGMDLVLPGPLKGPDVSIASFVRRRFGSEVLERLVDPLLAGTRAGRSDELSLAAAVPQINALARKHRSLVLGLSKAKRAGARVAGPPPFLSLEGGMDELVDALARSLRSISDIRTSTSVTAIEQKGDRFVARTPSGPIESEAIVLAVPTHAAATLLAPIAPAAASTLSPIVYASAVTATLVYEPRAFSPPEGGSGLLVASGEHRTLAAATWYSRKWPRRAPADGRIVVKCFAGRAAGDEQLGLDDDELVHRMAADLGTALQSDATPIATSLVRWERALPQYAVGHLERVAAAEAALPPGIALAGAGYRGSGLPDCIESAAGAAQAVLAHLQVPAR